MGYRHAISFVSIVSSVVYLVPSAVAGQVEFRSATLGGTIGLSADGNTFFASGESDRVYRWTGFGAPVPLTLPAGAVGRASSGDGRSVVGVITGSRAFQWTLGAGVRTLDPLPGNTAVPSGVNFDGTVVVGNSGSRAVRWVGGGTPEPLPIDPRHTYSSARSVSRDGQVISGYSGNDSESRLVIWRNGSIAHSIPFEINGPSVVSPDGSRVIALNDQVSTMVFTATGTAVQYSSEFLGAYGITADNEVVFGDIFRLATGWRGAFWTSESGVVDINDYLAAAGVDLTSWRLISIGGISDDRRTIFGSGFSRSIGGYGVWIANLPYAIPAPGTIIGLVSAACFTLRRRRSVR